MRPYLATAVLLALAACGGGGVDENGPAGEGAAETLQNAANQADPAAAAVMRNGAEQIEKQGQAGNLSDPNGAVQNVMEEAGRAQVAAPSNPPGAAPPSGSVQARPNLPQSPNRKDGTAPPDKVVVQPKVEDDAAVRPR